MTDWLARLREVLDGAGTPVRFFFRDDDAGWDSAALLRLLDVFDRYAIPLDLAVIPCALTSALAAELLARHRRAALGLHQHGYRHINHEPEGRKCEFGPSRNREQQYADLAAGRRRLQAMLGNTLDPIFTPPWNRCTDTTVEALESLGIRLLSRDASAKPLMLRGLNEVAIHIDWLRRRNGVKIGRAELGLRIAERAGAGAGVGVMLHHADLEEADFSALEDLLILLSHHRKVNCRLLRDMDRERAVAWV